MAPVALEGRTGAFPAEKRELGTVAMTLLALGGACATGLLAQVRIPLWFTPVPLTGQVLGVLLCAAMLGRGYGLLSQVFYVALGAVGVPWFAHATGGFAVVAGVTGGYLAGFMVAAWFVGGAADARLWTSFIGRMAVLLAGVGIIYAFGMVYMKFTLSVSYATAYDLGVKWFIPVDVAKAMVVATLAYKFPGRR